MSVLKMKVSSHKKSSTFQKSSFGLKETEKISKVIKKKQYENFNM